MDAMRWDDESMTITDSLPGEMNPVWEMHAPSLPFPSPRQMFTPLPRNFEGWYCLWTAESWVGCWFKDFGSPNFVLNFIYPKIYKYTFTYFLYKWIHFLTLVDQDVFLCVFFLPHSPFPWCTWSLAVITPPARPTIMLPYTKQERGQEFSLLLVTWKAPASVIMVES